MSGFYVVSPCKTSGGMEIKLKDCRIDLKKAEAAFSALGQVVGGGDVVLLAKVGQYSISVYASGRMLVKDKIDDAEAHRLAQQILAELDKNKAII